MVLAYLLRNFGDAVEADLMRYYQVRLTDMWRGIYSVREISVWVKYLPRGATTWEMTGGRNALTAETESIWVLSFLTEGLLWQGGGGKGQKPKPPEFPEGYLAEQSKKQKTISQAEAFRRKHLLNKDKG